MRRARFQADDDNNKNDDDGGEYADAHHDGDSVPLHHQRAFGAGLKRKRVEFVRAQDPDYERIGGTTSVERGILAGDLYANIVLGSSSSKTAPATPLEEDASAHTRSSASEPPLSSPSRSSVAPVICEVCSLPITTSIAKHESSLAHLASLPHSHPPSSLDRARMGLRALASQGWDPDSRLGLGREGEGMRFPIKVTPKEDTLGVGAATRKNQDEDDENEERRRKRERQARKKAEEESREAERKKKPMNAKQIREMEAKERRKGDKLRGELFGSVDVEGYLRGDGRDNL